MSNSKAIVHGTLIDGNGGKPVDDSVILIKDEVIENAGKFGQVHIPKGAQIIDATGKHIIPGIIEGHAHLSGYPAIQKLQKSLQRGITTVASVCANAKGIELRDIISECKLRGCAKLIAGCIVSPTHGHVKFRTADGPWEVRKAVREMAMAGADFIKTAASGGFWAQDENCSVRNYTYEELNALTDETHAWNLPVAVHVHTDPGISNCIKAQTDMIHHGAFIDEEGVNGIKQSDLYFMPTLRVTSERNLEAWPQRPWMQEEMRLANPIHREGVRLARKKGVKILVGTDFPGSKAEWEVGEATFWEMMEMQKCGYTPMELITAATKSNATAYRKDMTIGTIEKNKYADVVILNKTPLEDISVLHNKETVALVLRDGIIEYADDNYKDLYKISYF